MHQRLKHDRLRNERERERERVVRREVNGNDNGNPELGIIRYNEPLRMMHGLSILVVFRSN